MGGSSAVVLTAVRRLRPVPIVSGVVALVVLWLVRPLWHGVAMFFWTGPIVWLPPVVVLAVGAYLLRRSRRSWTTLEDLRAGVRPPPADMEGGLSMPYSCITVFT